MNGDRSLFNLTCQFSKNIQKKLWKKGECKELK